MNSPSATTRTELYGAVYGSVYAHSDATAFSSKHMRSRRQHEIYSQNKAPGPERPASAAGIGPFGLRLRSRALRAGQGANLN